MTPIRVPLAGPIGCPPGPSTDVCPPTAPCAGRPAAEPEVVGDEYLCDGGDKELPVHYEGHVRAGLDTEDTVVEFVDQEGRSRVKPSSQVCIYAPRFAAVRSATQPQQEFNIDRAEGRQDRTMTHGLDDHIRWDEQVQADQLFGMRTRSRASGVQDRIAQDRVHQTLAAQAHVKLLNAHEDFRFLRSGEFDKLDSAVLQLGIQAAIEWSDNRTPIVYASETSAQSVLGRSTAQDYTGAEDLRRPGELTLVKVADKSSAHPGDVVTFTIRIENTGDLEFSGIRVVDNLTPRLALIDGSVDSNLPGRLTTEPSGAGGTLLTFQFTQPLAGHASGHVSFQCRVR